MGKPPYVVTDKVSTSFEVVRWRDGVFKTVHDEIAEEVPVALVYNGVSHVVMLATPQDLDDFALGFSITEGILQNKHDLYETEVKEKKNGIEVHLNVSTESFLQLKERRRNIAGRTGCGLCGAESLEQVFRLPNYDQNSMQKLNLNSIMKAQQALKRLQKLQQATGATHACAWADQLGNIRILREDVGRHNALDKLIGALVKAELVEGFILTTSRASYEMVQKTVMAGFNILAAISAPTGLAVRIAEDYNVTLIGFVRDKQYVAYSHSNRIISN